MERGVGRRERGTQQTNAMENSSRVIAESTNGASNTLYCLDTGVCVCVCVCIHTITKYGVLWDMLCYCIYIYIYIYSVHNCLFSYSENLLNVSIYICVFMKCSGISLRTHT